MLVKDVMKKYHAQVPFPWTLTKIAKAGFEPKDLFLELGEELAQCVDVGTPAGRAVLESINKLKQERG